nr:MAG: hypothetical protein [Bacteriophage sp.]
MEFVELKNQVVMFGKKMQSVRADHEKKIVEIKKTYVNAKIPQFVRDENERYQKAVQSERLAAINTLNDSVKKLEASQNGGINDKIDTVMLNELNAISQSEMGLTAAELKAVGQRVLASGSAICCRKLTDIAHQSGYQLHLPDPAEAKKVLYEASEQILNFFKFYDGSNPYASNVPYGSSKYSLMASARFLDDYEKRFERATGNTLADTRKALEDAEGKGNADAITEAAEKLKEMVQSDSLPEEKPSKGAEFARKYSEKMGPRNGNQQPMFIQPSPGVKSKRAPRPTQRPDISLDTSVSFAAQAAQRASKKAWEEAARLVDNSAEIPDTPATF